MNAICPDGAGALIAAGPAFLAILPGCRLLTPDLTKVRVAPAVIRSALCATLEAPILREIQETLDRAQIPPAKQARACAAILRERLSAKRIRGIWLLRLPPGASFREQLRHAHVPRRCSRWEALMRSSICSGFWPGTSSAQTFCAAGRIADG